AGACVGPDFERALEVDLRIAGDGARFSTAGVADPVACGVRLARLLGEARAKELILAGRVVDAPSALRLGLVTRVVPESALGDNAHTRWWTDGPVGTIVLDNPPMNVLSDENRRGIREALAEFRDAGARAVVLTGAGERAFCGGADLKEEEELTAETVGKFLKAGDETFRALREYDRPIVAEIGRAHV